MKTQQHIQNMTSCMDADLAQPPNYTTKEVWNAFFGSSQGCTSLGFMPDYSRLKNQKRTDKKP